MHHRALLEESTMRNLIRILPFVALFLFSTAPRASYGTEGLLARPSDQTKPLETLEKNAEISCKTFSDALTYASAIYMVGEIGDQEIHSLVMGKIRKDAERNSEIAATIDVEKFSFIPEMARDIRRAVLKQIPTDTDKQTTATAYLIGESKKTCVKTLMDRQLNILRDTSID